MKSRQRLEKTNQRFSEGSLLAVSKPQESTTNSTAPLQGSLRLEIVGQTPTNPTNTRGGEYVFEEGEWWYLNGVDGGRRRANSQQARQNTRMWVDGKYVSKSHPLYRAGRYKGFEEAAFSSLENYKESAEGEVYVITNKAWDGWVKVGMAVDAEDRLKNYQTSSPFRDYVLYYSYKTDDRRKAESKAHSKLEQLFERNNEWFKCTPQEAKGVLNEQQQNNG